MPRAQAFESCQKDLNIKSLMPQGFIKKLKAWCHFNGYTLNPKPLHNTQGRVIRKLNDKATEMIYVQTTEHLNAEVTDDMPF